MHRKVRSTISVLILLGILCHAEAAPLYRIVSDTYTVTGRTRPTVLKNILGSAEGLEFDTPEEIDSFTAKRKKKLDNLRSFKHVAISISLGSEESGVIPVSLETAITDGTAFIPIPYIFYNSNDGFMAGLVANAPNFAGTLQNLTAMGLYAAAPDDQDRLQWSDPNFMAVVNWSNIRLNPLIFQITTMAMRMNRKIEELGVLKNKFLALNLTGIVSAELPLTDTLSSTSSVKYTWGPNYDIDYITEESLLPWGPIDSSFAVKTGFVVNKYHWEKNFRNGWQAEIVGGIEHTRPSLAAEYTSVISEAEVSGFHPFSQRLNLLARGSAFARSGPPDIRSGKKIRGIRNGELRGNIGLFLNTGVQFFLVRIGSVELHVVPCFDVAWLYTAEAETREFDWGAAAGAELLIFLDALKSLPIKFGAAYDLRPEENNGSGKFYEIDFSFALTY